MTTSEGGENQNSQGEGGEENKQTTELQGASTSTSEAKTFTQEEVNRFNTKAKRDGEKAAVQSLVEKFGRPIEEVEQMLKGFQAKQDAEKTETERLREQNESLKKDSEAKVTQLQREHHTDRVKYRLSRASLALPGDKEEAEKALDRVVGLVSVQVGASAEDIDTNIDELKSQFPSLFQAATQEGPKGNPSSTVTGVPRQTTQGGKSPLERARERAAKSNERRGVSATS